MVDVPQHWDLEVDFISIGSGIGGLTGAIVAHDEGQQVAILEKTDKVGGVTAYSGGDVWVGNNHLEKEQGIEDSDNKVLEYLEFLSGGEYEEENLTAFIANAPLALKHLMERAGVRFAISKSTGDYYSARAPGALRVGHHLHVEPFPGATLGEWQDKTRTSPHMPPGVTTDEMASWGSMDNWDQELLAKRIAEDMRTSGPGLAAYLVKAALVDRQIPCYIGTPAEELVTRDGVVMGVRAKREGNDFFLRARKGVLIATSAYDYNRKLAGRFDRAPEWNATTFPGLTGDGLIMGTEIGAAVGVSAIDHLLASVHVSGETHEGVPLYRFLLGGMPGDILVNREGNRFTDESFYRAVAQAALEFDARTERFKNFPFFLIFDRDHREKFPVGGVLPGQPLPEGLGAQAETLGDLAEKLGIDPNGLEKTVVRFNGFARQGRDLDFHRGELSMAEEEIGVKPSRGLGPLERPPFYGIRLTFAAVGVGNAGLMIDGDARVLGARGDAIPGLYAAGNAAAHLEAKRGYENGISNARGMTHGFLAARHAARQPARDR